MRQAIAWPLAAAVSAATVAGQLVVGQSAGLTTFGSDFTAGAERTFDAHITLMQWMFLVGPPVAAAALARWWPGDRWLAALPGAAGAAAVIPLLWWYAGPSLDGFAADRALLGLASGTVAVFVLAGSGRVLAAIAAHAAVVWLVSLALRPSGNTVLYAGMGQVVGVEALDSLRPGLRSLPYVGRDDYHLAGMLPVIVAVLVLSVVMAAVAARSVLEGFTAGLAGPFFAALTYAAPASPDHSGWNAVADRTVTALAVCCAVLALLTAVVAVRWREARRPRTPDGSSLPIPGAAG